MARLTGPDRVTVDYVTAKKVDMADRARRHVASGREACHRLDHALTAVAELFGEPLRHVLDRAAENVIENYAEAIDSWDTAHQEQVALQAELNMDRHRLRHVVTGAAEEIQRRYGKRLPDELRPLVDAAGGIWPWLYPPADERHEHEINSGGACKHPLCRHIASSDYGSEPF